MLQIVRNRTWAFDLTIFDTYVADGDPGNVPTNHTGWTIRSQIRTRVGNKLVANLNVTFPVPASGTVAIRHEREFTRSLATGDYWWDIVATDPAGDDHVYVEPEPIAVRDHPTDPANATYNFVPGGGGVISHTHSISDVTGLQTVLDGKAATSHTHVSADITDATSAATGNTLVRRTSGGGASLSTVTLSGTGGSPFTSTLTGGVNFANRTLVLPDVSGTLVTAETLANSATITASTAVAVDTIVLRDGAGQINITNSNVAGTTAYASTAGWTYAGSAASAHRTALGLGTGDSPTFTQITVNAGSRASNLGGVKFADQFDLVSLVTNSDFGLTRSNVARIVLGQSGVGMRQDGVVSWTGTTEATNAKELSLLRDAANTLAQRNGNAAQESRIYGTYSGAGDYRRLALKMSTAGVAQIVAEGLGSGAVGNRIEIDGLRIGKGSGDVATNTTLGSSALNANTTGSTNTAVGHASLQNNTTGGSNSAIGGFALNSNTIGQSNSAVGGGALAFNTSGSNNTAVGRNAGRYIADGTTANAITANSVYLGTETKALASNQTNQIVIGNNATGLGSNTAVLGNDSIVTTALKGNVGIGTTSPSALLDVNSDTVRVRTARTPASATAAGNAGDICWDADYIYVCTATDTWKRTAISTWP